MVRGLATLVAGAAAQSTRADTMEHVPGAWALPTDGVLASSPSSVSGLPVTEVTFTVRQGYCKNKNLRVPEHVWTRLGGAACFTNCGASGCQTSTSDAVYLSRACCRDLCSEMDDCHSFDMPSVHVAGSRGDPRCYLNSMDCMVEEESNSFTPDPSWEVAIKTLSWTTNADQCVLGQAIQVDDASEYDLGGMYSRVDATRFEKYMSEDRVLLHSAQDGRSCGYVVERAMQPAPTDAAVVETCADQEVLARMLFGTGDQTDICGSAKDWAGGGYCSDPLFTAVCPEECACASAADCCRTAAVSSFATVLGPLSAFTTCEEMPVTLCTGEMGAVAAYLCPAVCTPARRLAMHRWEEHFYSFNPDACRDFSWGSVEVEAASFCEAAVCTQKSEDVCKREQEYGESLCTTHDTPNALDADAQLTIGVPINAPESVHTTISTICATAALRCSVVATVLEAAVPTSFESGVFDFGWSTADMAGVTFNGAGILGGTMDCMAEVVNAAPLDAIFAFTDAYSANSFACHPSRSAAQETFAAALRALRSGGQFATGADYAESKTGVADLVIAVEGTAPGFSELDAGNGLVGADVEIIEKACTEAGLTCRVVAVPFETAFFQHLDNTAPLATRNAVPYVGTGFAEGWYHCFAGVRATADRAGSVMFSQPYTDGSVDLAGLLQVTGDTPTTVGLVLGYAVSQYFLARWGDEFGADNIQFFPSQALLTAALANGDVDSIFYTKKEIEDFVTANGATHSYGAAYDVGGGWNNGHAVACHPKFADKLNTFNGGLQAYMNTADFTTMCGAATGVQCRPQGSNDGPIAVTSSADVVIAVEVDNAVGAGAGDDFHTQIAKASCAAAGLTCAVIPVPRGLAVTYNRNGYMSDLLLAGSVHCVAGVLADSVTAQTLVMTSAYTSQSAEPAALLYSAGLAAPAGTAAGLTVGVVRGRPASAYFSSNSGPGALFLPSGTMTYDSLEDAVQAIRAGQIHAIFEAKSSVDASGMTGLAWSSVEHTEWSQGRAMACHPRVGDQAARLDSGLRAYKTSPAFQALCTAAGVACEASSATVAGLLTSTQAASIVIGVTADRSPFSELTLSGVLTGFDTDLILEVCRRANLQCAIVTLSPDHVFAPSFSPYGSSADIDAGTKAVLGMALGADWVDCVAGVERTARAGSSLAFSNPYTTEGFSIACGERNAAAIQAFNTGLSLYKANYRFSDLCTQYATVNCDCGERLTNGAFVNRGAPSACSWNEDDRQCQCRPMLDVKTWHEPIAGAQMVHDCPTVAGVEEIPNQICPHNNWKGEGANTGDPDLDETIYNNTCVLKCESTGQNRLGQADTLCDGFDASFALAQRLIMGTLQGNECTSITQPDATRCAAQGCSFVPAAGGAAAYCDLSAVAVSELNVKVNALCLDRTECEELCTLMGPQRCTSIDMHKTLPRCYLNRPYCTSVCSGQDMTSQGCMADTCGALNMATCRETQGCTYFEDEGACLGRRAVNWRPDPNYNLVVMLPDGRPQEDQCGVTVSELPEVKLYGTQGDFASPNGRYSKVNDGQYEMYEMVDDDSVWTWRLSWSTAGGECDSWELSVRMSDGSSEDVFRTFPNGSETMTARRLQEHMQPLLAVPSCPTASGVDGATAGQRDFRRADCVTGWMDVAYGSLPAALGGETVQGTLQECVDACVNDGFCVAFTRDFNLAPSVQGACVKFSELLPADSDQLVTGTDIRTYRCLCHPEDAPEQAHARLYSISLKLAPVFGPRGTSLRRICRGESQCSSLTACVLTPGRFEDELQLLRRGAGRAERLAGRGDVHDRMGGQEWTAQCSGCNADLNQFTQFPKILMTEYRTEAAIDLSLHDFGKEIFRPAPEGGRVRLFEASGAIDKVLISLSSPMDAWAMYNFGQVYPAVSGFKPWITDAIRLEVFAGSTRPRASTGTVSLEIYAPSVAETDTLIVFRVSGSTVTRVDTEECSEGVLCTVSRLDQHGWFVFSTASPNSDFLFTVDVNECVEGTHNCEAEGLDGGLCTNTVGGFTCGCAEGYVPTADGVQCISLLNTADGETTLLLTHEDALQLGWRVADIQLFPAVDSATGGCSGEPHEPTAVTALLSSEAFPGASSAVANINDADDQTSWLTRGLELSRDKGTGAWIHLSFDPALTVSCVRVAQGNCSGSYARDLCAHRGTAGRVERSVAFQSSSHGFVEPGKAGFVQVGCKSTTGLVTDIPIECGVRDMQVFGEVFGEFGPGVVGSPCQCKQICMDHVDEGCQAWKFFAETAHCILMAAPFPGSDMSQSTKCMRGQATNGGGWWRKPQSRLEAWPGWISGGVGALATGMTTSSTTITSAQQFDITINGADLPVDPEQWEDTAAFQRIKIVDGDGQCMVDMPPASVAGISCTLPTVCHPRPDRSKPASKSQVTWTGISIQATLAVEEYKVCYCPGECDLKRSWQEVPGRLAVQASDAFWSLETGVPTGSAIAEPVTDLSSDVTFYVMRQPKAMVSPPALANWRVKFVREGDDCALRGLATFCNGDNDCGAPTLQEVTLNPYDVAKWSLAISETTPAASYTVCFTQNFNDLTTYPFQPIPGPSAVTFDIVRPAVCTSRIFHHQRVSGRTGEAGIAVAGCELRLPAQSRLGITESHEGCAQTWSLQPMCELTDRGDLVTSSFAAQTRVDPLFTDTTKGATLRFGGLDAAGELTDEVYSLYDEDVTEQCAEAEWRLLPALPAARAEACAFASNRGIYIVGGRAATTPPALRVSLTADAACTGTTRATCEAQSSCVWQAQFFDDTRVGSVPQCSRIAYGTADLRAAAGAADPNKLVGHSCLVDGDGNAVVIGGVAGLHSNCANVADPTAVTCAEVDCQFVDRDCTDTCQPRCAPFTQGSVLQVTMTDSADANPQMDFTDLGDGPAVSHSACTEVGATPNFVCAGGRHGTTELCENSNLQQNQAQCVAAGCQFTTAAESTFAGGDGTTSCKSYLSRKVWKSTDAGATWAELGSNLLPAGLEGAVAVPDGNDVYVTGGRLEGAASNMKVYKIDTATGRITDVTAPRRQHATFGASALRTKDTAATALTPVGGVGHAARRLQNDADNRLVHLVGGGATGGMVSSYIGYYGFAQVLDVDDATSTATSYVTATALNAELAGRYTLCFCDAQQDGTHDATAFPNEVFYRLSEDMQCPAASRLKSRGTVEVAAQWAEHNCFDKCSAGCQGGETTCRCGGYDAAASAADATLRDTALCLSHADCRQACTDTAACTGYDYHSTLTQCFLTKADCNAGARVAAENFDHWAKTTGAVCSQYDRRELTNDFVSTTSEQRREKTIGELFVSKRPHLAVDYVVTPKVVSSVEITGTDLVADTDRIMIIECQGICGVSNPTTAVTIPATGWHSYQAYVEDFAVALQDLPEAPPAAGVTVTSYSYKPFIGQSCPVDTMEAPTEQPAATDPAMSLFYQHQCFRKCFENTPCVSDCFCEGYFPAVDVDATSPSLCLDQMQCQDLCSLMGSRCAGIEMHQTSPRCFIKTPGTEDTCAERAAREGATTICGNLGVEACTGNTADARVCVVDGDACVARPTLEDSAEFTYMMRIDGVDVTQRSADQMRTFVNVGDTGASWNQLLRFTGVTFTTGGTFKLCFCDSVLLGAACSDVSHYNVEVGRVHASGVYCLLKERMFQQGYCVSQYHGGLRCYPSNIVSAGVSLPAASVRVPTWPTAAVQVVSDAVLSSWCLYAPEEERNRFEYCGTRRL